MDLQTGNSMEGARLNCVARSNDSLITVLIAPENTAINVSPWYAFKLWSETESEIQIKLTYPESAGHRYFPKLSLDGLKWEPLDSAYFQVNLKSKDEDRQVSEDMTMKLSIGPDTLWIAAQELITSSQVDKWLCELEFNSFVTKTII